MLNGKDGADTLNGLAGADVFIFDTALGPSNFDKIADFSTVDDTIDLDNAIFTSLPTTGALASSAFKNTSTGPVDADDRILYNPNTGNLAYDADGSGNIFSAVLIASLTNHATLTPADFVVV